MKDKIIEILQDFRALKRSEQNKQLDDYATYLNDLSAPVHQTDTLIQISDSTDLILQSDPIEEHTHIPILDGKAHVTWHGEVPPSEKQMKAFEEMVKCAKEMPKEAFQSEVKREEVTEDAIYHLLKQYKATAHGTVSEHEAVHAIIALINKQNNKTK